MLRSQLRRGALAVLGALLLVALLWPTIGLAMPTPETTQQTRPTNCIYSDNGVYKNCSESEFSLKVNSIGIVPRKTTAIDHSIIQSFQSLDINNQNNNSSFYFNYHDSHNDYNNAKKDNYSVSNYSDSDKSRSRSQQILEMLYIDDNMPNRTIRTERVSGNYTKRKRKKNLVHLTAESVRTFRTHQSDNVTTSNSDHRSSHDDVTTILPNFSNTTYMSSPKEQFLQHLSRTERSIHLQRRHKSAHSNLDRNERSANLSHISGSSRKIQLYIKNRYIQVLPDGTINGTENELSDYTIFQRFTVDVGQIQIQGIATCLFLCMDPCGSVYASRIFNYDCVFNESMEQHYYNTYSSTYNSNSRGVFYLALNRHGEPRKLKIPSDKRLGKLAMYAQAITETVPQERVEQVIARMFGANHMKHGTRHLCDHAKPLVELTASTMKPRPNCTHIVNSQSTNENSRIAQNTNGRNNGNANKHGNGKKKKKRRRCRADEVEHENCHKPGPQASKRKNQKLKCGNDEECKNRKKAGKRKKGPKEGDVNALGQPRKHRKLHQHHQTHQPKKHKGGNHTSRGPNARPNKGGRTTRMPATTVLPTTLQYQKATESVLDEDGNHDEALLSSTEAHEEDEDEDSSSVPSIGGHTQLVGGDEFFYDNEFDM